jgi:hypothetical protein
MTAHYYRYADVESPLSFIGHFGFFGAAMFAFLSGYGVCISYQRKGIGPSIAGNFLQKIKKCYIPFLLVNCISILFVYGFRFDKYLPLRILLGIDDGTMWYIPYIMAFYLVFAVIYAQKWSISVKNLILSVCICGQIIICMIMNVDSQWYTASGALLAGVLIAQTDSKFTENRIRFIFLLVNAMIFVVCSILTKSFESIEAISKTFTIISGIGFSCIFFYGESFLDEFIIRYERKLAFLLYLGQNSLWIYCIHMKVMKLFYSHPSNLIVVYIIAAIAISATVSFIYMKADKKIQHSITNRQ